MKITFKSAACLSISIFLLGCGSQFFKRNLMSNIDCVRGNCEHDDDQPKSKSDDSVGESPLSLDLYSSCDELQNDVHKQMKRHADNEQLRMDYYKSHNQWAGSAEAQDATITNSVGAGAAPKEASQDSSSSSNSTKQSFTNNQVQGVDESDFVKIADHHIYVARSRSIEVIDRKDLHHIGALTYGDISDFANPSLYVSGDTLILISESNRQITYCPIQPPTPTFTPCNDGPLPAGAKLSCGLATINTCRSVSIPMVLVRQYKASPGSMPSLVRDREYTGTLKDSRLVDDRLILIFADQLQVEQQYSGYSQPIPDMPILFDQKHDAEGGKLSGVKCTSIAKPVVPDFDFRFTKVVSLSVTDPSSEFALGVVGGGDVIYMTTKNLYIAKQGYQWTPWIEPMDGPANADQTRGWGQWVGEVAVPNQAVNVATSSIIAKPQKQRLFISKIALLPEGKIVLTAAGEVEGTITDRWAFNEFSETGILAVVTTTNYALPLIATPIVASVGYEEAKYHHLWTLKTSDRILAIEDRIDKFGDGEDVRAVRYLGCVGYVVTYHATDPLFAFDFTSNAHPKLLGELKIDGFSGYLHPVDHGRLLGVGYATTGTETNSYYVLPTGVQISLYDTSDAHNMTRLDNKVLGDASSRSLIVPDPHAGVQIDAHAFYFDPNKHLAAIPVELNGMSGGGRFNGAVIYIVGDKGLTEAGRITHADLGNSPDYMPNYRPYWTSANDIARIFTIDDRLVSVSRVGLASHAWASPMPILTKVVFADEPVATPIYGKAAID